MIGRCIACAAKRGWEEALKDTLIDGTVMLGSKNALAAPVLRWPRVTLYSETHTW